MKATYHTAAGGAAAAALIPVLGYTSIAFFAASVLIDGDHYLDYLCRNGFKDFSVKRMFAYNAALARQSSDRAFIGLSIGHTAEFIGLVFFAAFYSHWPWLEAVAWGIAFHMVLDLIHAVSLHRIFGRAFSLVEYVVRWQSLKRKGLEPERLYREAVAEALERKD